MPIRIAAFLLAALLSQAQSAWFTGQAGANSAAPKNRYKVSGTVINSATGEPIPRALVSGSGIVNGSVFTDGSGKFEANDVPEGPVFFSAQRPGFFPEGSTRSGNMLPRRSSSTVDAAHTSFQVKLVPAASIHGRATDSDNQPIEAIRIQLISRTMQNGIFRWQSMNSTNTDETGAFTFPDLLPGTYVIRSTPRRLYLDNSDLVIDGQHYPDLYAGAFFPGVPDRASAQPVALAPGVSFEADLRIPLVATYSISGSAASGTRATVRCADEDGESLSANGMIDPRSGHFTLTGVPPGPCTIVAQSSGQRGQGPSAELPVNVTAEDITGVSLVFHDPLPNIPITVIGLPADQKTPAMSLSLISRSERPNYRTQIENQPGADGALQYFVRNPTPGAYRLIANSSGNSCVGSIESGGTDLTKNDLVISRDNAPSQIEVKLRTDCASATISIEGASPNVPNNVVPILITGGAFSPRLLYLGGKMIIPSLSPGDYTFYALSDISNLEYGNPEVLKKLSGQQVTIAPSDRATIQLKLQTSSIDAAP